MYEYYLVKQYYTEIVKLVDLCLFISKVSYH